MKSRTVYNYEITHSERKEYILNFQSSHTEMCFTAWKMIFI